MHVDRSRFLWLTAAIASASCAPKEAGRAPLAPPETAGGQPLVVVQAEPPPPDRGQASGGRFDGANADPDERSDNPPDVAPQPSARQPGAPARSVLAEQCRSIRPPPGPQCESIDTTPGECQGYERMLGPEAAARATLCLTSKSGKRSICKFGVTADCFLEGSRAAPVAPQAQAACAPVVRQCAANRWGEPDMTTANCVATFSAVRPDLRGTLLSCMAEGCSVGSCLYGLEPQ
jgi:hypothetical protein